VLDTFDARESTRIALWVNGEKESFHDKCFLVRTALMPHMASPIFLGFSLADQKRLSSSGKTGSIAVAGWDPKKNFSEPQSFLFLKAE
jgi:hypothetical protein